MQPLGCIWSCSQFHDKAKRISQCVLREMQRFLILLSEVSESHSVMSNSLRPHGLFSPWNSPGQNTGVGNPFDSQPRVRTQVSCIAGRFFTISEPQGKPKNTQVGSLSLLQRIFLTQESNQPRNQTRFSCIAGGFFPCKASIHQS